MTFHTSDTGVLWRGDGQTVSIQAWGRGVRVRASLGAVDDAPGALVEVSDTRAAVTVDGAVATVAAGGVRVVAEEDDYNDWSTGFYTTRLRLRVQDAEGRLLFEEITDGGALKLAAREFRPTEGGDHRLRLSLATPADEHLVGMGLYQQDVVDLKGSVLELAHRNSQTSVPFVVSSAGYGFLWNLPAVGRAVFGTNRTEWEAESATQFDWWVCADPRPAQIAAAYAEATGHAPMMPEYGLGFWQCKLRYSTQEELLSVAREYRRRGIPIDVIVADFFHWRWMGDWRFEEEYWPDPAAMTAELRKLGIELMVSVWPQVAAESENFAELRDGNMLVRTRRGIDVQYYFDGQYTRFLDVTEPRAREFLWRKLAENYGAYGISAFWLDEAEPEYGAYHFENYRLAAGPSAQVANLYPREFTRAIADGLRSEGNEQPVSLVRAAWAGSQRHGALVWSGDVHSTFADLRAQIAAGIHMGAAGIPWFTTDIGGFTGGDVREPAFHELLIRWFQFGAFSPVMRLHGDRVPGTPIVDPQGVARVGTGADNEVWSFGPEIEAVLVAYIRLREDLRDYTRAAMADAHHEGSPVMRGMFFEFPDDEAAWTTPGQYLFGPDILVAPVTEPGATRWDVYLPAGPEWTDARTGEVHSGGQTVTVDAPLASIPIFHRGGRVGRALARLADLPDLPHP
ncbi:TIM-barrel domain-containing protein [Microbacterium sp. NPDC079995]|uniref:glycoside hydrolase family 31 protein n=1 Tax=unclassified Microbacterium TaxID=2609290 RepID=UPI00344DB4A7